MPALSQVLSEVRRAKTEAQASMKAPVSELEVIANESLLAELSACEADIAAACHVSGPIKFTASELATDEVQTRVRLA